MEIELPTQPPLPDGWDRCQAYLPSKKRYCRQRRNKGSKYCGNHLDYEDNLDNNNGTNNGNDDNQNANKRARLDETATTTTATTVTTATSSSKGKGKGKRIPCPLDPSHTIYESNLKAHLKKCNKAKQGINDRKKIYYKHGVNLGGFGSTPTSTPASTPTPTLTPTPILLCAGTSKSMNSENNNNKGHENDNGSDEERYQNLAICILRAYEQTFAASRKKNTRNNTCIKNTTNQSNTDANTNNDDNNNNTTNNDDNDDNDDNATNNTNLSNITKEKLYKYIPYQNHFTNEKELGLEKSISEHRIKIGGAKHLEQIGSIVGHVRGMITDDNDNNDNNNNGNVKNSDDNDGVNTILEMGAGRATTGFVVASVVASHGMSTSRSTRTSTSTLHKDDKSNNDNTTTSTNDDKTKKSKNVKLILVERAGSRGKADRAFRRGQRSNNNDKNNKNNNSHKNNPKKEDQLKLDHTSNTISSTDITAPKQSKQALIANANIQNDDDYMNVDGVNVQRIKCDLAHVHLPTVLSMKDGNEDRDDNNIIPSETDLSTSSNTDTTINTDATNGNGNGDSVNDSTNRRDIIVIAKHCCGVGTDLALKSLLPIKRRIHGCLIATCCHGICSWDDYVGRSYLYDIMMNAYDSGDKLSHFQFGKEEFDLMKRWACGTVIGTAGIQKVNSNKVSHSSNGIIDMENDESQSDHPKIVHEMTNGRDDMKKNITFIVKSLNLKCGLEGLGRACQRLIDYGRCCYMQEHLFNRTKKMKAEVLSHYVDSSITPQNALLKGRYS